MVKVGAVLLAAGASHRFGTENKLVTDIGGLPLIRRVAVEIARSSVADVVVVTGCDQPLVERVLDGLSLNFAYNPNWPAGMGSSIAVGISALDSDAQGALVVPGDMPFLTSSLLDRLILAFNQAKMEPIIFPTPPAGEQGNPVLWPRRFFPLLTSLSGPEGGKRLLASFVEECRPMPLSEEVALMDVDTPNELALARAFWRRPHF
jgi:molybdenum cofactor cytidylyltransferase